MLQMPCCSNMPLSTNGRRHVNTASSWLSLASVVYAISSRVYEREQMLYKKCMDSAEANLRLSILYGVVTYCVFTKGEVGYPFLWMFKPDLTESG